MPEKLRTQEHESNPEASNAASEASLLKRQELSANKAEKLDIGEARAAINEAAPIAKEVTPTHIESESSNDVRWWSKELGKQTFDRTLTSVRRHLTTPEKQLSKFIHRPLVEKISDFGGKTIARPSGILLGGIFSFVGSLGVYLIARHLGGELRYSIFAATLIGGYLLGLIVEFFWWLMTMKKRRG